jgi:hypothetical protein
LNFLLFFWIIQNVFRAPNQVLSFKVLTLSPTGLCCPGRPHNSPLDLGPSIFVLVFLENGRPLERYWRVGNGKRSLSLLLTRFFCFSWYWTKIRSRQATCNLLRKLAFFFLLLSSKVCPRMGLSNQNCAASNSFLRLLLKRQTLKTYPATIF